MDKEQRNEVPGPKHTYHWLPTQLLSYIPYFKTNHSNVNILTRPYSCTMFSRNRVAVQVNHQKFQVLSRSGNCLGERSIMKPQHHGMSGWKPRMQRNWLWWGCFLWHSNGLNDETDPPSFAMFFFAFLPIARIKDEKIHQWKPDTEAWALDQTGTTKMIKYKNILRQFDQTTPQIL